MLYFVSPTFGFNFNVSFSGSDRIYFFCYQLLVILCEGGISLPLWAYKAMLPHFVVAFPELSIYFFDDQFKL